MVAEALELARRAGNPLAIALAQCRLGHLELGSGELGAAAESFNAASKHAPVGAALGLAEVAQAAGNLDRARSQFQAALRAARQHQDQRSVACALHGLGSLARARGAHRRAVSYQRQALVGSAAVGDRLCMARCIEELGALAAGSGRVEQGARLFGAARSLLNAVGVSRCTVAEAERAAWEALGDDKFNAAVSEGLALSVDEAVAFATRGGPGAQRPRQGWEALTPVERQIVALVAKGRTNPQIAKPLLMSPRTVDSHLRDVFAKLDVASRTELAVLADRHERGAFEGDGGTTDVE